jgi:hydroxyacylglutathione hydrolase
LLEENQKQKIGNLEFEVIFIPGHTKGHIAFFFSKEKIAFTGDTLFSLGCGRVFEGTHEEMFHSLNKIKNLPPDTKIYCGHEYTKSNLNFCLAYDTQNTFLKEKAIDIQKKLNSNLPTIPTILGQEIKTNIFLRCNDPEIKLALDLKDSSEVEVFSKLRDLKDSF